LYDSFLKNLCAENKDFIVAYDFTSDKYIAPVSAIFVEADETLSESVKDSEKKKDFSVLFRRHTDAVYKIITLEQEARKTRNRPAR
jgi:hypothetical protein